MRKKKLDYDFSGYATKINVKCSDGRTILKDAFKDNDGQVVPLVWQHLHDSPDNILGHALLENREDGVYAYGKFNDTEKGKVAKELVHNGDIISLSIFANKLQQRGSDVVHGMIREVSLVIAGANSEAFIDYINIQHADGSETQLDTEAIIYSGEKFELDSNDDLEHEDKETDDKTVKEIFETLTEEQKNAVYYIIGQAIGDEDFDDDEEEELDHSEEGKETMKKNIFEQKENTVKNTLTHAQFQTIMSDAQKLGSFKEAVLAHAAEYGIENIDVLFPDAKTLQKDPHWLERETGWVEAVLNAINKSPFSRIKTVIADMDIETARAKGYITGTEKKEVYFKAAKRVTQPTTIYVKQKLDRDDIIDVTDFDIVAMVRYQLRKLFNEELAMAALVGDGRELNDENKINEECIRPIWKDDDLYAIKEELTSKTNYKTMVKQIASLHKNYKGSGRPVLYTTAEHHFGMLWIEDNNGRRIYTTDAELCDALRVSKIEEIPILENKIRVTSDGKHKELVAIKVNLQDYTFGADKGGQTSTFDDFDIDFNQYKYLMEGRCSGSLTRPKSAQIFEFDVTPEEEGGE